MVFGVNDESQIANMALFEGVSPNYLKSLIKQKTNQGNEARTDEKTLEIINSSSCFYIYGMGKCVATMILPAWTSPPGVRARPGASSITGVFS